MFIIMYLLLLIIVYKKWEDIMVRYEQVTKTTGFYGTVYFVREYKSRSFIRFENGDEYYLPWADNYNYAQPYLNKFVIKGDSIIKLQGTDTLRIIREQEEYVFVLYGKIDRIK